MSGTDQDPAILLPPGWESFGQRWQAWRERHDRRRWADSWQGQAFRQQRLRFPSPWDEQLLETRISLRQHNHLAYLLRDPQGREALVFAGLMSNGHELEALYLPADDLWLHAPVSVAPASWYAVGLQRLTAQLKRASALPDPLAPQAQTRLWLEGHANFAHQLLNGLTCLDGAAAAELGPVLSDGPEAFGPLSALFPAVGWIQPGEADRGTWFELPLSQRPERISPELRRHLRHQAAASLSQEAMALEQRLRVWKAGGGWVLAVSVKARGAVAEGLNALISAALAALAEEGPLPLLLIDGFSPPTGASSATVVPPYLCPMAELISTEAEQIRGLSAALVSQGVEVEQIVCAGRPLLEALHLLQYADVYVMHQGTVQHKIGWFQETIPGIVHSNSHRNTGGTHPWGGMGEVAPIWFPAEGCEDLEDAPRGRYRFRPERLPESVGWLSTQLRSLVLHNRDSRRVSRTHDTPQERVPVASLEELDAWVLDHSLKRYQQWIINRIPFAIQCDEVVYTFQRCRTTASANHLELRRRDDGAAFELISDSCGSGFSLSTRRPQPLAEPLATTPFASEDPVLRIGDPNFAHFLWNELDPLLHLLEQARQNGQRLPVVQDSDSILDLASLPGVERLSAAVLTQRPSVHLGAMRVSATARSTALARLKAPATACRRTDTAPLLILGVRGPGRRELQDEVTLLHELIHRLHQRWPALRIALDGFTFQHNNLSQPTSLARAAAIAERIGLIQAACPGIPLESLHGLCFEDYLPRVAEASVYVTHEGTIQHKIGWFYPEIPGVCLVAGPHAEAIGHWHRAQCEGSSQLDVLPVGLLVHSKQSGDADQRNQPFASSDPLATIAAIEQLIAPHLEAPPSARLDLVTAVWDAADPMAALTQLAQSSMGSARESRSAVFTLCDAACLTRNHDHLAAAAQELDLLPADDHWVRLHRLRLQIARGDAGAQQRETALALLADAGQLDAGNRQLLASLLHDELDPAQLTEFLPEFSPEELALLQGRAMAPETAAVLVERLLDAGLEAGAEACQRAARFYSRTGPSLRRPFQSWDNPQVADPTQLDGLVQRISAALDAAQGFGLIRLGDGEGCFLAGRTQDLEGATRNGDVRDPALEASGGHLGDDQHQDLLERLRQVLQQADVVAIPDLWQCLQGPEQSLQVAANLALQPDTVLAGGWHLHLQLLRHGAFQRPPFDRVDAVIGAALPPALRDSGVAFLPLPGEDPFWRGTERPHAHYPQVYRQVLEWIEQTVRPGQLVLVGGGLLGKIYVGAIQAQGGVGLDVGSVIDLCDGHTGHRGEHRLNPYLASLAAAAFRPEP